jgi:hypothetical protein
VLLLVVVLLKSSACCTSNRAISSSVRGASEIVLAVVDGMVIKRYDRSYSCSLKRRGSQNSRSHTERSCPNLVRGLQARRGPRRTALCRAYHVEKPGDRELRVRVRDSNDCHQSIDALVYLTYTD